MLMTRSEETTLVLAEAGRSIRNVAGNNMEKEIFEKEIAMCRELSKKNGGKCKWGGMREMRRYTFIA